MPILTNILKNQKKAKQQKQRQSKKENNPIQNKIKPSFVSNDKKEESKKQAKDTTLIKNQSHIPYNIVVRPHISEKSINHKGQNKYVFEVFASATASSIGRALSDAYGVEIENVSIVKVPNKKVRIRSKKRNNNKKGTKSRYNKCIITLKKGSKIEILPK